jgi:hypothetical protein
MKLEQYMFTPAKTFLHGNGRIGVQNFKLNKVFDKDNKEVNHNFETYELYYGKRISLDKIDVYLH